MPNPEANRQKRINDLRIRIAELRSKIEKMEWDERMRNVNTSYSYQSSLLRLKYQYQTQLRKLQYELQQLESNF